jgi:hypothetical protein
VQVSTVPLPVPPHRVAPLGVQLPSQTLGEAEPLQWYMQSPVAPLKLPFEQCVYRVALTPGLHWISPGPHVPMHIPVEAEHHSCGSQFDVVKVGVGQALHSSAVFPSLPVQPLLPAMQFPTQLAALGLLAQQLLPIAAQSVVGSPQVPPAVQVCTVLPLQLVSPGVQLPLHMPLVQIDGHDAPSSHTPLGSQLSGMLPLHFIVPCMQPHWFGIVPPQL